MLCKELNMIKPELNDNIFTEATERVKPSLVGGKLEYALLGIRQQPQEIVQCLNIKHENLPALRNKVVLLASISKAITGTAVARLVDQRLISWTDPLCNYLEDMRNGSDDERITIGDIFLHRTGYADIDPLALNDRPPYEAYRLILQQGLAIKPQTAFLYSTTSYWFVNALVHKLLGFESMEKFLKEWIFTPCNMNHTTFHPDPEKMLPCRYYSGKNLERFMQSEVSGSGLWSNIDDLLKFGQAVITPGKLMKEETLSAMTEAYPLSKYGEPGFSCRTLGWAKEINFKNQPARGFFHGGYTGGVLWCDPEYDFVAVFLSNRWWSDNLDAFNVISTFYGA